MPTVGAVMAACAWGAGAAASVETAAEEGRGAGTGQADASPFATIGARRVSSAVRSGYHRGVSEKGIERDQFLAETDAPVPLKALGLLMGLGFSAFAVVVVRDALPKPFSVGSLLLVLLLVAFASIFVGLLVWRTRLYAEGDTLVVERRGYLGTTRRVFVAANMELMLDRGARWGLLAKAVVPRFVVKTRDGEVLFEGQWTGVEQLAERFAKRMNRPLRG